MNFADFPEKNLHEAAFLNDVTACKSLIKRGADVNEAYDPDSESGEWFDSNGARPLHWAVINDSLEAVKCLVEAGADPNAKTFNTEERLYAWAERKRDVEPDLALIAGYVTSSRSGKFLSPQLAGINYRICKEKPETAGNAGACNKDETPLHWAAKYNAVKSLKYLIERGAGIHEAAYNSERTPLHLAAGANAADCVKILLANGADATGKDSFYATPLHYAAGNNAVECVELLLNAGADVDGMRADGKPGDKKVPGFYGTPLLWAVGNDATEAARALLAAGASVKIPITTCEKVVGKDTGEFMDRLFPLHVAAGMNAVGCVKLLLAAKAKVDEENFRKETPLYWAARHNALQAAEVLVEKGANVDSKEKHGKTPLHHAAMGLALEMATFLLKHKAKINHHDADGATPLDCAMDALNEQRKQGASALAMKRGEELIAYLKKNGAEAPLNGKRPSPRQSTHSPRFAPLVSIKCLLDRGLGVPVLGPDALENAGTSRRQTGRSGGGR